MNPSPFPGMDPYLEAHWLDVHTALVGEARTSLNQILPEDLAADAEERVAIESDSPDEPGHRFHPDVRIFEPDDTNTTEQSVEEGSIAAPVRLLAQIEPVTERFIRIVEVGTERMITVIEFVSSSNKRNPGLAEFRSKRAELITAGVNFVEIDLVRDGNWVALLRPHRCPSKWASPYRVTVRMPSDPAAVGLYPVTLRRELPSIIIPLRRQDPEIRLNLQELLNQAYINGRYARRLNYREPPNPPLDEADRAWAETLRP